MTTTPDLPAASRPAKPDPVIEQVVDAAMTYVERHGFDQLTVEDLVRESGVPRTTIYRKLGSRDEILRHLLLRMMGPYLARCRTIAAGPGSFLERLEEVLVASILNIDAYPWLKAMLAAGMPETSFAVFDQVSRHNAGNVLRHMLQSAITAGVWNPPAPLDDITHWLLRQILVIGAENYGTEEKIRHHIRIFIMPVFSRIEGEAQSVAARLAAVEQGLERVLHHLKG